MGPEFVSIFLMMAVLLVVVVVLLLSFFELVVLLFSSLFSFLIEEFLVILSILSAAVSLESGSGAVIRFLGATVPVGVEELDDFLLVSISAICFLKYEELIPSRVTMNFGSSRGCSFLF